MEYKDFFAKKFIDHHIFEIKKIDNKEKVESGIKIIFEKNKKNYIFGITKINWNVYEGPVFSINNRFKRVVIFFNNDNDIYNDKIMRICSNINSKYLNIFTIEKGLEVDNIFKNNNIKFLSHDVRGNNYTVTTIDNNLILKVFNYLDNVYLRFYIEKINILDLTNLSGEYFYKFIDCGRNIKNIEKIILTNNANLNIKLYETLDIFNLDTISYNVDSVMIKNFKNKINKFNIDLNKFKLEDTIKFNLENSMKFKILCKYFHIVLEQDSEKDVYKKIQDLINLEVANRLIFIKDALSKIKLEITECDTLYNFYYKIGNDTISEIIIEPENDDDLTDFNPIYTIGFVATRKEFRRFGISTMLFKELFKYFGHNVTFMLNPTEVGKFLYRKFGFMFHYEYKGKEELPEIIINYDAMFWNYKILKLENTMKKLLGDEYFKIFISK